MHGFASLSGTAASCVRPVVSRRQLAPHGSLERRSMHDAVCQLPGISKRIEELLNVPLEPGSRTQISLLAVLQPWFGSVRFIFRSSDRADSDFFNRLSTSTHSGE